MNDLVVTILAGGEGKRMRSNIPKVLHLFKEKPMLVRVIETIQLLQPKKIVVVTGKYHSMIIQTLVKYIDIFGIIFITQGEPLGTGHAISCCLEEYENTDKVLIVNSDTPLITVDILQDFMKCSQGSCNILTAEFENPHGYGRIIYDKYKDFIGIIEEKDCSESQRQVKVVNGGIYYIDGSLLKRFIPLLSNNNSQKEYYLTDIVKLIKNNSWTVIDTILLDKSKSHFISGVNTPEELEQLL
jgi:UDP-N-acetylglucosamine diphosphorylase/glucosamine-1-phosphate N-acetyltransferase